MWNNRWAEISNGQNQYMAYNENLTADISWLPI